MAIARLFEKNGLAVIYESANNDRNSSNYVLSIGSRFPEQWINKIPSYNKVSKLSDWIAESPGWLKFVRSIAGKKNTERIE
jgi:hypothetical protein